MILAFSGVILRPSGFIFECFGGPFGDPELPRAPRERQGGKSDGSCGLQVLPGIAKQAFCRHGMVVFEVCVFFVFLCDVAKVPFCAHRTRLLDENVGSWVLPGGSQFQQNPRKIEKKSLGGARWKALCARCCTRGASGPPPTMKTMVLCNRNHRFHSSPGGPKQPEIVSNRFLLGHLWVGFWPSGAIFRGTGNR